MRLSDLEKIDWKKPEVKEPPRLETREAQLTTDQVVKELRMDRNLAKEKIAKIPQETKEELRPFFSECFWKEGTANG